MKSLRWMGLMASLLIVGAFGELLAPLPSDALTVTIDGSPVSISTTSAACSSGYNLCSFITPRQYGSWIVGDVSSTNKARIMIGDNSAASSLDLLKVTGITFTPVVTADTKTATVVVTHTYNAGGGNPQGDYSWGYGMSGYFDPPLTENIVGDRLRQTGSGNFAGTNVTLGLGLDTGVLATPTTNNLNGSVTKTRAATVVQANCNTGSARCAPTITQTFTLTVAGADKLVLSDSLISAGGTCRPVDQVIPIRPDLYALMLQLDPNAPNDINQLSAWLAQMGEQYLTNKKAKTRLAYLIRELDKWLAETVPGTCPEIQEEINAVLADDMQAELVAAVAAGAVPAEPAPDTGTVSFAPVTNFAVGSNPRSVAIGDLNSDGTLDLAVANVDSDTVSVLLGTGAFGGATAFAVGASPQSVAMGDLNGDGILDLATANESIPASLVSVLLGTGGGTFGMATTVGGGSNPRSVAIGDLNGDGTPDLAVTNQSNATIAVLLGDGTGTFGVATTFGVGSQPRSVAIGDLNGDGRPDLAVANALSDNVSVLLGDGTGTFGVATDFAVGSVPTSVAIGDLNGDGKPDLAVANESSGTVSVLFGTGGGAFGASPALAVGSNPSSVAIGDLNGDGKPDLAVANVNSNTVSVLLGTGGVIFNPAVNFAVGTGPYSVAIGDLNGDGKLDLAVANRSSNSVSILLNVQP